MGPATAIIIVSYESLADVKGCLIALDELEGEHEIGVFIVENGGSQAFVRLAEVLESFCAATGRAPDLDCASTRHLRRLGYTLPRSNRSVLVAEANTNLGYAGGVNSWLECRSDMKRWTGFWILNPDTAPDRKALTALIAACEQSGCSMAGSIILGFDDRTHIRSRGLGWRPWFGRVLAVDRGRQLAVPIPPPNATIDAPSGASIYVTAMGLARIGLMDETYFLYFEDLDWGMRAHALGLLCFADESFVPHKHGTALGSADRRAERSALSVFLDARNMLLFTKRHNPGFRPLIVMRLLLRSIEYLAVGSVQNCTSVLRGLQAGLRSETGPPKVF